MLYCKGVFLYFFAFFFSLTNAAHGNSDLEEMTQDFFIEIKQIVIPDCPWAFNPSLIRWKERWLMSFRLIPDETGISPVCSASDSHIGLIYLDDDLNPIGYPQFITPTHPNQKRDCLIAEDARLIICDGRLYVVYSGNKEAEIVDSGFRVYVAEIIENEHGFYVAHNECLSFFEGEDPQRREKNWIPFIFENALHLAYHLYPHRIFRPLLDASERCETVANSFPSFIWEYGELRGGTPAVKLDEQHYLGFFHSSIYMKTVHSNQMYIPHYFIGAYLFSAQPPFEVKYISPEPIVGTNFYHGNSYEPYWHPVCVVFPCGLAIYHNDLWISYGRQDHEIWVARLDKEKVLNSLIHVSSLK